MRPQNVQQDIATSKIRTEVSEAIWTMLREARGLKNDGLVCDW